jgi:hypothetical protein
MSFDFVTVTRVSRLLKEDASMSESIRTIARQEEYI